MRTAPTSLAFALLAAVAFGADDLHVFEGTVSSVFSGRRGIDLVVLETPSNRVPVHADRAIVPAVGARVRAGVRDHRTNAGSLVAVSFETTGRGEAPKTLETTADRIADGLDDFREVRFRGTVSDSFVDEIDSRWYYFVVRDGDNCAYAAMQVENVDLGSVARLTDAEVEISGLCVGPDAGRRQYLGSIVYLRRYGDIRVLRPAPGNPFDREPLPPAGDCLNAAAVRRLGRRTATGRVTAAWRGDQLLLRLGDGRTVGVSLAAGERLPRCGEEVQAVGYVETDFYRINLMGARVRPTGGGIAPPERGVMVDPSTFTSRSADRRLKTWTECFGKALTFTGRVTGRETGGRNDGRFILACGPLSVPVDASGCPEAEADAQEGAVLSVTGTCVLETENWRPSAPLPRIRGIALVVRDRSDVTVLSRPPWWTSERLLAAVAALLVMLVVIGVWNRRLKHLVERRSKELLKSEIDKVAATLRVDERTRLAVELHDSVTQHLTGVAMRLDASTAAREVDAGEADRHVLAARQMLRSCLDELRRCLWDLRSEALEEPDFAEAVRRTLKMVSGAAEVDVDFAVPRERLSDASAHAVLRVTRELVINAVRHGRAAHVRVRGELTADRLRFSVRDDGCGFDIDRRPGPNEGHFGLDGVRERIREFGGDFKIGSAPGKGTTAEVILRLPGADGDGEEEKA